MQIGTKISERRKALGITQIELAETMHVTRQTVSRWENGSVLPDIEKISELAGILGVSCDQLLSNDTEFSGSTGADSCGGSTNTSRRPSRLLASLEGKRVQFSFYDGEDDFDIVCNDCTVLGFDGTWFKVRSTGKNGGVEKLISAASVLSVKILGEAE